MLPSGPSCRVCHRVMLKAHGVVAIWRCECGNEIPRTNVPLELISETQSMKLAIEAQHATRRRRRDRP